jgi:adenosine deaminase CECR1
MMEEERKLHFSYECQIVQTEDEKLANEKLMKLKTNFVTPLYNITLHDFYEVKPKLEKSQLYSVLDAMPKGGLHHVHTTAAPHVDIYIELTYDPVTYYNEREGLFKVFPDHKKEDGYEPC